jgi:hypothetical protein
MTAPDPARPADRAAGPLPASLSWAVRLLYAEAVLVGLGAVYLGYEDVTGTAADLRAAILVTLYALALAGVLGGLAYALTRGKPWARGPVVVLQSLLLPIGYYLSTGGKPWLGVPAALLGLVVAGLLVTPSSTKALGLGRNRAD